MIIEETDEILDVELLSVVPEEFADNVLLYFAPKKGPARSKNGALTTILSEGKILSPTLFTRGCE